MKVLLHDRERRTAHSIKLIQPWSCLWWGTPCPARGTLGPVWIPSLRYRYPDPEARYVLYTDASKYTSAGVLRQTVDETHYPVAYVSGLFRGSQLNWAALTKEAKAIYMSVKKLSFYLDYARITVRNDHLSLKKFLEKNIMNSKVNNWAVELKSQKIDFLFIPGIKNVLADTLNNYPQHK